MRTPAKPRVSKEYLQAVVEAQARTIESMKNSHHHTALNLAEQVNKANYASSCLLQEKQNLVNENDRLKNDNTHWRELEARAIAKSKDLEGVNKVLRSALGGLRTEAAKVTDYVRHTATCLEKLSTEPIPMSLQISLQTISKQLTLAANDIH